MSTRLGLLPLVLPRTAASVRSWEGAGMDTVFERCAGLDIGKADLKACVRLPGPRGGRRQQVRTFATTTDALLELRRWLADSGVQVVGMEATGDYVRHEGA